MIAKNDSSIGRPLAANRPLFAKIFFLGKNDHENSTPLKLILIIEHFCNEELRVHGSIWLKMSTWAFETDIAYSEVLKRQKMNSDDKNLCPLTIQAEDVD